MPYSKPTYPIKIADAGATVQLPSSSYVERYVIEMTQTGTMSGNTSITDDSGSQPNDVYEIEFPGLVTLGAQTFTVFGKALTTSQALNPCLIVARWDGSAFQTKIYTDWSASNTVLAAHINNDAVTTSKILDANVTLAKIEDVNQGNVIRGNGSNRPEAYNVAAIGAGAIVSTDGTDVLGQLMTQDVTLSGALVATIANNAITTAKILDAAVTFAKIQALARGSTVRGSSSNVMEALAVGAAEFVMGDGTDAISQLLSGDATVDAAGVVTISAALNLFVAKVNIPTAQVLTLNSVPVTIVAAQGAGKAIEVISAAWQMTYAGVAYATNTNLRLITATATEPQAIDTAGLANTNTVFQKIPLSGGGANDVYLVANQALYVDVETGDPTLGTSDISVYCAFRVVDV